MTHKLTAALLGCFLMIAGGTAPASAQAAQWNQVIADRESPLAFYRALRESAIEHIDTLDKDGISGTITFVDHQLDCPIRMTSNYFHHVTINVAQGKAACLLRYQAKSSAGTNIPIAAFVGGGIGRTYGYNGVTPKNGGAE